MSHVPCRSLHRTFLVAAVLVPIAVMGCVRGPSSLTPKSQISNHKFLRPERLDQVEADIIHVSRSETRMAQRSQE